MKMSVFQIMISGFKIQIKKYFIIRKFLDISNSNTAFCLLAICISYREI